MIIFAETKEITEMIFKRMAGIDWRKYEAELAKELALKAVDSAFDRRPEKVAEYAVNIARAVVERLRRDGDERNVEDKRKEGGV